MGTFANIGIWFALILLHHRGDCLQCHGGTATWVGGKLNDRKLYEESCPEVRGQSCLTADTEVIINGMETRVVLGSCSQECRGGAGRGCDDVIEILERLVEQTEEYPIEFNVTRCAVTCCDNEDFCNKLPGIELPKPKPSNMMCYSGMSRSNPTQGVWSDDVKPMRCLVNEELGPETSCLKATITVDGGTPQTTGSMLLYQCQPTVVCNSFTCDLMMRTLPEYMRRIVTDCSSSCCTGNLCNRSNTLYVPTFCYLAFLLASLYVPSLLN